ncbi:MAG: methylenetetrahydrofolate reductase [Gammaproteobacteria bacterium]|nr:methylenetetrahydrofolate reductase [Gammaproteobacteria bacterium]
MERIKNKSLPKVSFEFFPPKTPEMEQTLWRTIERLEQYGPRFVSVTYGAGGSTRERTHSTVTRILKETELTPAAHLTCVDATRDDVNEVVQRYWDAGVRHIVALRGDPPDGESEFVPHPEGYENAAALVEGIKRIADFEVSVAAHPETHPDAVSLEADLENLKRKIDSGATRAITQYFFDIEIYLRFRDRAAAAGINVPIVPGILPVTNFKQVIRFSKMCGATVPDWLAELFDGLDEEPDTRQLVAAGVTAEQCHALHLEGVDEFHFYTLNRAELTCAICRMLGIKPGASDQSEEESGLIAASTTAETQN